MDKDANIDDFGFIITRHVNSQKTNEYWNRSVKLLNHLYPSKKIILIDDNSNYEFVKEKSPDYKNLEIIQSEYPGRGELLPYYYFYKRPAPFKNAVILHDSVFFHKHISFEKLEKYDVLPFWNFKPDNENYSNSLRIVSSMKNNHLIKKHISLSLENLSFKIHGIYEKDTWKGCFGVQSYINHDFLIYLVNKYNLFQLLPLVTCRADRCCLERIFGILFSIESKYKNASLLGNIHQYQPRFDYTYEKYKSDLANKKIPHAVVKVWTGR
jgi:hypothetical protein